MIFELSSWVILHGVVCSKIDKLPPSQCFSLKQPRIWPWSSLHSASLTSISFTCLQWFSHNGMTLGKKTTFKRFLFGGGRTTETLENLFATYPCAHHSLQDVPGTNLYMKLAPAEVLRRDGRETYCTDLHSNAQKLLKSHCRNWQLFFKAVVPPVKLHIILWYSLLWRQKANKRKKIKKVDQERSIFEDIRRHINGFAKFATFRRSKSEPLPRRFRIRQLSNGKRSWGF